MVSDIKASTYGIDNNLVYAELKWSVPSNSKEHNNFFVSLSFTE